MLEPVESLVYVYYKCTKCNEPGDEIRLKETLSCTHVCIFCGHVDKIKPIKDITLNFQDVKPKPIRSSSRAKSVPARKRVLESLLELGYIKKESIEVISRLDSPDFSDTDLFRKCVIELDNEK